MRRGPPRTAPVLSTWADRPCITRKKREFRISGAEVRKVPESRKIEIEKDYRDRERI